VWAVRAHARTVTSTKIIITLLVATLVQLVIVRYVRVLRPVDVILIVTVYVSFARDPVRAMLVGASAGLLQDGFSGGIVGAQSLAKTVVALLISLVSIRVALDHFPLRVIALGVAVAVQTLLYLGLHWLFGQNLIGHPVWPMLLQEVARLAGVNGAAALVLFGLLDRVFAEKERTAGRTVRRRR
jgi:rod shape-determining protein MreD